MEANRTDIVQRRSLTCIAISVDILGDNSRRPWSTQVFDCFARTDNDKARPANESYALKMNIIEILQRHISNSSLQRDKANKIIT